MKKIFTFVVALMTVLTISAQDQKTNVWSGTQAMDGMFPFTVEASAFADATADQKLSITVADVAAGAYVNAFGGDYATEVIPYTEIAAAGDVVFELTASTVNTLKSTGLVLMGGVYTITSIDLVAGQVGPDPTPGTVETYLPTDETGVAKAEWPATATEGQQNVVDIDATANVHLKAVSGAIADWNEGETLPLTPKYGNNWDVKNNRNNIWDEKLGATKTLYFLNGVGNPTSGVAFVEKRTDGQKTGVWRRCFDRSNDPEGPYYAEDGVTEIADPNFYYQPDGSAGLPNKYGVYYQVTAKTAGTMKFLIWNNNGNRSVYIADATTGVALDPMKGEVKYSGYVNGKDEYIDPADESKGKKMTFFENLVPQESNPYCPQAEINQGQAAWIYLTFEMEAGKTYYIFNHNTQLGFGGFEFTPGSVDPALEPNPKDNLLDEQSYNFNEGIGGWYGWGAGSYEQAKPGYEGSAGCLHLTSPAAGDAWSSQLAYNITLEQGQDYTMSFVAKAKDEGGKIQFSYQNSQSYTGGGYQDVNLTTDWAPYSFHWDAISQTDVMDRFTINYGAVANEYFIDRVCLIKGKPDGIEEVNFIDMKKPVDNRVFNLQGVQVDKNYKGVVIMNGKRFLQR